MEIKNEKQLLRREILATRDTLDLQKKAVYDQLICEKLVGLAIQMKAEVIHCYLPINSEINTHCFIGKMLEKKKTVVCAKTQPQRKLEHLVLSDIEDVEVGLYNTLYPKGNQIYRGGYDLIVVPGVAFDKRNYRLGYGGGYYDSFLNEQKHSYKVAPCYPFQQVDQLPKEKHDEAVDLVVWQELRGDS